MRIVFSIIACALLACCAIHSPQAGPVGFRLQSGFKPSQIPGLQLWLDASQIVGLNDGDAVATWSDLSGNANDVSQATASKRPTYQTAEINGLPVVRTDGVDDLVFTTNSIVAAQPLTLFVVARENSSSTYLMDGGPSGAARVALADFSLGGSFGFFAGSSTITAAQSKPIPLTLWRLVVNGASSELFKNSVSFAAGNPGSQSLSAGITLGARYDPLGAFYGSYDICEVLVYDTSLSAGNLSAVEAYLRTKWGTP